ncbi:SEP domain-containing protein [Meloidogyne graminicola]|uniref:SEP domain-containing protein n=1 Tax=Meloidogyne graminicola TaxID=189291 RepID=A0A8S9ZS54_9BILA|nr:SEP domain-containing protein [Meloidogyne graminicola]
MSNIHGLNTDDDGPGRHSHSGSEEDEDRQGFFVGGSTRSGQQVLGPNRRDLDSHLFNAIQRAGAERLNPEQVQALGQQQGGSSPSNRVTGGFRLGGHGIPSEIIGGSNTANNVVGNTANRPPQQVVRMYIWRNGFSLDDGPLRQFNDPSNQGFLQAVTSKRIPTELLTLYPGREVDLRVERKPTDYVAPKAKPFSGQGYRLGSLLPGDKKSEE